MSKWRAGIPPGCASGNTEPYTARRTARIVNFTWIWPGTGLRMPIGAGLVLHEHPKPEAIIRNGQALGKVVAEAARRYRTPLAFAHMDLH
mgnify:CR=1 FL=1